MLLRESQVQPLLLVFEDLHWIDSETQALLDSLVEPAHNCCWSTIGRSTSTAGAARRTTRNCGSTRCRPPAPRRSSALLGDDPSLRRSPLLIARTEGNPFFLEESVRTLVETGVLAGTPGAYRLGQPLQGMPVPATARPSWRRIDRLPPEDKRLLQTAAVIGTDVPFALLRAIADVPEALHRGLAHLQAAEFLYETRLFPSRNTPSSMP